MSINRAPRPRLFLFASALAAVLLVSCSTIPKHQYTSGQDYLARYNKTAPIKYGSTTYDIDQEIREIAAIEPDLRFPARIGLARIERGRLVSLPLDETDHWQTLAEDLGREMGTFVPVSPFIAQSLQTPTNDPYHSESVINTIRKGAARQHIDYVLIYEVSHKSSTHKNALSFTDLSVLGLFVLPSRNIEVTSTASAILMDVRNGYPYLTATEFTEDASASTSAHKRRQSETLKDRSRIEVVQMLSDEIGETLKELQIISDNERLSRSAALSYGSDNPNIPDHNRDE